MKNRGLKSSCLPISFLFGMFATSCLFLLAMIFTGTTAEGKVKQTTTPLSLDFPIDCRPYHLRSMKVLLKSFNKCSRELKANSSSDKEFEENMGCAMKCTMQLTGYAIEGRVTIESMTNAVARLLPHDLVDPIVLILINRCHNNYEHKLDPNEPACRTYSEYGFCIQNTIADLVDSEYCIKYDKKGNPITTTPAS